MKCFIDRLPFCLIGKLSLYPFSVPFREKIVYDRMEVMIRGHVAVC